jgi:rhodanese-related sulfurtransferase
MHPKMKHIFIVISLLLFGFLISVILLNHFSQIFNSGNDERLTAAVNDSLSCERAFELWKDNHATFIDVRHPEIYQAEHIPNAISLPYRMNEFWDRNDILSQIHFDTFIIVYCDSYICRLSEDAVSNLKAIGYEKVFYLVGGLNKWKKLGYPTEGTNNV